MNNIVSVVVLFFASMVANEQASAQGIGGNTDVYMPPTSHYQSLSGPGWGQATTEVRHSSVVNSSVGSSWTSGSAVMFGSTFVPDGARRGSASFSSTMEGGMSAGHWVDRSGSFSSGGGWLRTQSSATAEGGGSANVVAEGSFNGSSSLFRPRNRGQDRQ